MSGAAGAHQFGAGTSGPGGSSAGDSMGSPAAGPAIPNAAFKTPPVNKSGVPNGGNNPEQGSFLQIVPSPHYTQDRTIFASGVSFDDCAGTGCPVLFKSTDAGAHWTKLGAGTFQGGTVMLPPSYPADSRIFAGTAQHLQVSTDNGDTFQDIAPAGFNAAMAPDFSSGDPLIFIGEHPPGWVYTAQGGSNGTLGPLQYSSLPASDTLSFGFSPTYATDRTVLVGTEPAASATPEAAAVSVCHGSVCGEPVSLPGAFLLPQLFVSRSFDTTGLALAWRDHSLYRSTDGGRSFSALALPGDGSVRTLTEGADGALYLGLSDVTTDGRKLGGLFVSRNQGSSWTRLGPGSVLDQGVQSIAVLAGGRLLVGPAVTTGGGVRCSADGGASWAARC